MPSRLSPGQLATLVVASACAFAAAPALAASGGASSGGGGAVYVTKPEIKKIKCVKRCASHHRVKAGSTLRVTGSDLRSVRELVFVGGAGRSDDAVARVRPGSNRKFNAKVPLGANSGPLVARISKRSYSRRSRSVSILPPPPPSPNPRLTPVPGLRESGAPRLETGTSRTRVFTGARRAVIFSWRVSTPAALAVQLVRASDNVAIRTWTPGPAPAGTVHSVVWTGRLGKGVAGNGRYAFKLTAKAPSGAIARSSSASDFDRDAFDLHDHVFPIRAKHTFNTHAGRFGASRGGRSHQGQDTFAKCGSKLVAARGGKVQYSGHQGAAGNYIVIDGAQDSVDYAYMHLREPSPFRKGDRVYTNQRIGSVGDTGDAVGCHLHFEMWSSPGWYEGGHAFDPLPSLRAWDAYS